MARAQNHPTFTLSYSGGVDPHRESKRGGFKLHVFTLNRAQAGLKLHPIHSRLSESPTHMLVGISRQADSVMFIVAGRVKPVMAGKPQLRGAESGGQVGAGLARALHRNHLQINLTGPVSTITFTVTRHAHPQPQGIQSPIFNQRQNRGPLLGGLLGDRH